jgi:DNA-binding CsgD family transcriptional regulator
MRMLAGLSATTGARADLAMLIGAGIEGGDSHTRAPRCAVGGLGGLLACMWRAARGYCARLGESQTIGTLVANLAILASDARQHHRAAHLFGAAKGLKERAGQRYPPFDADASGHSRAERETCQALGDEGFARARSDGQALSTNQIIALALAGPDASEVKREAPLARLSPREREIATLIAQGLTNRQMADRLIIAERTADTHVQNILAKLGCASRREVGRFLAGDS